MTVRKLLAAAVLAALALLGQPAPAGAATPVVTLHWLTTGYLGLDGGTAQRFEAYWLAHGGPKRVNTRKHPLATFDPLTCTWVYGTLCALAVASLDAAAVADPGR
jgi:hypothetical protein